MFLFPSVVPSSTPSWIYYCDRAIPFDDSASGDYAACAKDATVLSNLSDVPPQLQEAVRQALIDDTYVDDGGVGAESSKLLSELQVEIDKILKKGDFHIKAWESSGETGSSKYLGMTWNRQDDQYLLKFRLNLHQKIRGIPTGEDLDSKFLQDKSVPITKKKVLSVACQFYNPNGLATPLMFPVRALFSEICRDCQCSLQTPLPAERADRFRFAVEEILKTKEMSFPRQIVFKYSGKLRIFFDRGLQGFGACIYMESQGQFNLLISSAKIMGKAAYTALPSLRLPALFSLSRWNGKLTWSCQM